MLGFSAVTAALWLAIAALTLWQALRLGETMQRDELAAYARQILAAATVFADDTTRLVEALDRVQAIDAEASDARDAPSPRIQLWRGDTPIGPTRDLPSQRPPAVPARQVYEHAGRRYLAHVADDPGSALTVRISVRERHAIALSWPTTGFVLVPLLISLPFLLIPAWFTIRSGLRPLRELVASIDARVKAASLEPLRVSAFRELSTLVESVNQLMARLRGQLARERIFVADVAHQLKTPLAVMQANVDLARAATDDARRRNALRDLDAGIARADHLIRQLLRLARMAHAEEEATLRRLDLAELVRERAAMLVPLADRRRVGIEVDAPDRCARRTDPDAIAAILDNLLENAIRFSPEGGTIRVRVATEPGDANTVLEVADEGPGIAPSRISRAFERFTQLEPEGGDAAQPGGTGLGLAIVRSAVRRLHGTIELSDAGAADGDPRTGNPQADPAVAGGAPGTGDAPRARRGLRAVVRFPASLA